MAAKFKEVKPMMQRDLESSVRKAVASAQITDLHTHLYAPCFGDLLYWGVDELLSYHYLSAETMHYADMSFEAFYALPKAKQAELAWEELFIKRSPLSEACRGVLGALRGLGLKDKIRDLAAIRAHFVKASRLKQIDLVFKTAGVKEVVMTNDPFDDQERKVWEKGYAKDTRFHAALRLDPLLDQWPGSVAKMKAMGYKVKAKPDAKTLAELRRYLKSWIIRTQALYVAASLKPDFNPESGSPMALILEKAILPIAREHNLPFALMLGVRRALNPALRSAGDGMGRSQVAALEQLCMRFPQNKFMATVLSRESQHQLAVAGRKFRNLLVFGCWWFMNVPSLIKETTQMRTELLGLGYVPQHSDARVLEQLVYKWDHSRRIVADVLVEKYQMAFENGWEASPEEIQRDVDALFSGNFWEFLKRRF
jgi:hypothetical protein